MDNVHRMLFELHQTANDYNISISIPNTKYMAICNLALNNQPIEQMKNFEYLVIIVWRGENEVNKAARVSECLYNTIWGNKYMSITSKAKIHRREWREDVDKTKDDRLAKAAHKGKQIFRQITEDMCWFLDFIITGHRISRKYRTNSYTKYKEEEDHDKAFDRVKHHKLVHVQ